MAEQETKIGSADDADARSKSYVERCSDVQGSEHFLSGQQCHDNQTRFLENIQQQMLKILYRVKRNKNWISQLSENDFIQIARGP